MKDKDKTSILIVEDEAIVAADLSGKLGQLGYEVAGTASQGEEAVAMAEDLRPDLILMDIRLGGAVDGIEAAASIRNRHDLPVIYLTAHSDAATLGRAKLTGPFGYILKPFEGRDLATQIELALYKHRADREIREQREWLRVTLTSIGDAVIAVDSAGRITFVNPVAESLTGWKAEEATGRSLETVFRVVNERTGETLMGPVIQALKEGRAVALANHTALVTKDGTAVPVEDSAAPILDADGRVIGAVLVFHDVTERRRAEEALQRSHGELEKRVKERTAELEWRNRELQEFASVASHDLQEPLRKIKVFGGLLQEALSEVLTDEGRDYLLRMTGAADRMQNLVRALLSYSRVSAKAGPFRRVDLKEIATRVVEDLEADLDEMQPAIEIGNLPEIDADPVQIYQLLQNLLSNAIRYSIKGRRARVRISCRRNGSKKRGRKAICELRVEDKGIGFDMSHLEKIFLPFERLHGRGEYGGTGMGLAICRKIAERHGGKITAESRPGEGATFIVILPMRQA